MNEQVITAVENFEFICKSMKRSKFELFFFSDVAGFESIASAKPAMVITFLNTLDTLFEFLVNQNQVYMVQTVGDGYLVVAGCPTKMTNHAQRICDMAFDVMDAIR